MNIASWNFQPTMIFQPLPTMTWVALHWHTPLPFHRFYLTTETHRSCQARRWSWSAPTRRTTGAVRAAAAPWPSWWPPASRSSSSASRPTTPSCGWAPTAAGRLCLPSRAGRWPTISGRTRTCSVSGCWPSSAPSCPTCSRCCRWTRHSPSRRTRPRWGDGTGRGLQHCGWRVSPPTVNRVVCCFFRLVIVGEQGNHPLFASHWGAPVVCWQRHTVQLQLISYHGNHRCLLTEPRGGAARCPADCL